MPIDTSRSIPLADFVQIQHQGEEVVLVAGSDGQPQVIAVGHTSSGREVAWIRPEDSDAVEYQVAQRFVGALTAEYGPRITNAVADELHAELTSGRLQTSTIGQAVRMAESQQDTFGGINFFLELHCSATALTPAFRTACGKAGLDVATLSPARLKQIDVLFRSALSEASQGNREPLSPAEGVALLERLLITQAPASTKGDQP
ncbi:hypothetical protein [Rugamonas aquatica]|uniref:Uncharacterized protein n=1 Tax=Rugamonas aquatica TaxID=2743357 RepID=A0A6A7N6H4_9BURK|nr:hypothetical protein [Rugamonas aquatica]MQA40693.1 hypothetical protein [Rugamonas aquatica]